MPGTFPITWDKPKRLSGWLWLLLPAGICVFSTALGALFRPKDGDWIPWALAGLVIATIISFGQSIWLARVNTTPWLKFRCALACFFILMMVNSAVSFAGCAVYSSKLGHWILGFGVV